MKNNIERSEERIKIYERDNGLCQHCYKEVPFTSFDLAHQIADAKWARKKYGDRVIDHPLNRVVTCKKACCNDGVLITFNKVKAGELADKIRDELLKE